VPALIGPRGHPALLVSLFVPWEGMAPGESGRLVYWRELWPSPFSDVSAM
jgi:hypothetical protein